MMSEKKLDQQTRNNLTKLKLLWGGLCLIQFVYIGLILAKIQIALTLNTLITNGIVFYELIAAFILVMLGVHLRMQAYKKYWQGNVVTSKGYFQGNLIMFACCMIASFLSVFDVYHGRVVFEHVFMPLIVCSVFLASFPNGKPMQKAVPGFMKNKNSEHAI